MGFKLQDKIQQMRGVPGKYKRILTAIAQRARNDGTNFYESKESIADKAGVSRWTAYRNIEGLEDRGILVPAVLHECSNKDCPKGSRHYYAPGNHWTRAYNIDLVALQNATWESEKSRSKMPNESCSKMLESHVAKCDAIQEDERECAYSLHLA